MERQNRRGLRGRRMAGVVEGLEGRRLLAVGWSTYLGGADTDQAQGMTVDGAGNVYVVGQTLSSGWAGIGALPGPYATYDGFVVKVNADGTLGWSMRLGGSGHDCANGVAVDSAGSVYVAGSTTSPDWVSGGADTSYSGHGDGFVAKINPNGTLAWSSYLSARDYTTASAIAVDGSGNLYVTGGVYTAEWISNQSRYVYHHADAFLARIGPSGGIVWTRDMGGGGDYSDDGGSAVAVDRSGSIYVAGSTHTSGWVSGGGDTSYGGSGDGFVAKYNADGVRAWSSYVGGSAGDDVQALAVDGSGSVYVAGTTTSSGWASGGFDTTLGYGDGFVAKLGADGRMAWSSYLGGNGDDYAYGVAVDRFGNAYVGGETFSSGWAKGTLSSERDEYSGAFLAKVAPSGTLVWAGRLGGSGASTVYSVAVDAVGNAYLAGDTSLSGWTYGGFDTSYDDDGDGFVAKLAAVQVQGTDGADQIAIGVDGLDYVVGVNGSSTRYHTNTVLPLRINGLAGDDRVVIAPEMLATLEVYGGDGNDTVQGGSGYCSIFGGTGDDSLAGGLGADLIEGGEGNDTLLGNNGSDTLYGHDGADLLKGGAGEDELYGNLGNDTMSGGDGQDVLRGGLGADDVLGGVGDDSLYGGDGADVISGEDGRDYIEGRGKADTIYGGAGNDTVYGGAGADLIYGEDGDDWVDVGVSAAFCDSVDGGAGRDTVLADGEDVLDWVEVWG